MVADPVGATDCHAAAAITDLGDNLDDDGSCSLAAGTDLSDTARHLDPSGPEANGGPTDTISLDAGGAAIDHVSNATLCPATDQRGAPGRSPATSVPTTPTGVHPSPLDVSGTRESGGGPPR